MKKKKMGKREGPPNQADRQKFQNTVKEVFTTDLQNLLPQNTGVAN